MRSEPISLRRPLLIFGAFCLAIIAVLLVTRLVRTRRSRAASGDLDPLEKTDRGSAGPGRDEGLRALHRAGLGELRRLGIFSETDAPPDGRLLARIRDGEAREAFARVARSFARVAYGGVAPDPSLLEDARQGLERLRGLGRRGSKG